MAVKIIRRQEIMGKEADVTVYLPEGQTLNTQRRLAAEALDQEIRAHVENMNRTFGKLPASIRKDLEKWRWLGGQLALSLDILKEKRLLEQRDIDNYAVWAGYGQYMRPELSRGVGTRRSGSRVDHYRKCWLLALTTSTNWVKNWSGWDAFVDRGEQLVSSGKLMPLLDEELKGNSLKKEQYQELARLLANAMPSVGSNANIALMDDSVLEAIVKACVTKALKFERSSSKPGHAADKKKEWVS